MTLVATDLHSGYGSAQVLHGISLSVDRGEIVAVVGRNGVGKTTLVKSLIGVLPPTGGTISLDGTELTRRPPSYRVACGLRATFQERSVFAELTVAENLRLNGFGSDEHARILAAFSDSLSGREEQAAGTLSGGEQKMLAAAAAVASDAPFLVMDEPTEGLQPLNVDRLGDQLDRVRASGRGVLLIEQHLALATRLADRFVVLEKGEVVEEGAASDPDIQRRVTNRLVL